MNQWLYQQKAVSSVFVLVAMSVLALSLPLVAKMVQQSQDFRSSAAENNNSLKISPNKQYVSVGYTTKFELKFSKNIKDKTVIWYTDKPRIVKVNKKTGEILGLIPGEANVYAYNPTTKLRVSGKVYVQTYFEVLNYPKTMRVKEKNKVTVRVSTNSTAYFESSNSDVVSVNKTGGILMAKKKGVTYIKVTAKNSSEIKRLKITVD